MNKLTLFILIVTISSAFGVLNFVTDSWIKIILSGKDLAPAPVGYHSSVLNPVNNTMIIFGGRDTSKVYNSLVKYDLISDGWLNSSQSLSVKNSPAGSIPSARYGHSGITTPFNTMYIFGGRNLTTAFNDIYKYNMENDTWILINPSGTPPSPRWGHSAVMYPIKNQFLFFGGANINGTEFYNDIAVYDFEMDAWLPSISFLDDGTTKYLPSKRAFHSAVFTLTNQMVIFGGQDLNGSNGSIYFFSAETSKWLNPMLNDSSETIPALKLHSAVITPLSEMLVFGGIDSTSTPLDTVYKFDFSLRTWTLITPGGVAPDPRYSHTAICTLFNTMIIFGGQSTDSNYYNDLGKYNVLNSVLRSDSDGVVLVVLLSLVGSMVVGLCFALDLMAEKNEVEKYERELKQNGAELKTIKKEQRQPLFEKF